MQVDKDDHYRGYKTRKSHRNTPSFSSTLLDEIYRSTDGSGGDHAIPAKADYRDANSTKTTCLVEKWMMERGINDIINSKAAVTRTSSVLPEWDLQLHDTTDHRVLFFSSNSNSTSSNTSTTSGALSYSDTEFFGDSCFPATAKPKPVRITRDLINHHQDEKISKSHAHDQDDSVKSRRSTALKIYAGLKKLKQPISPGGKLTNFINSLFTNGNGKKKPQNDRGFQVHLPSEPWSTCSVSRSRDLMIKRNGDQPTVRFHPVDQDSKPCRQSKYREDCKRPPLPPNTRAVQNASRVIQIQRKSEFSTSRKIHHSEDEDGDEDAMSESSSDLFEIDHLAMFGSRRYSQELPVYETTYLF